MFRFLKFGVLFRFVRFLLFALFRPRKISYARSDRNGYNLNLLTSIKQRASLVPAAAVIPALLIHRIIAAVKKLVVGFVSVPWHPPRVSGCYRFNVMFGSNEEFQVSASHQLALITSLPFVYTARRCPGRAISRKFRWNFSYFE